MRRRFAIFLTVPLIAGACQAPRAKPDVRHPDPSVKIPAMKMAVRTQDHDAVAQLIEDLDSDDPAVRLYAIEALRRITGEDHGYQYWNDAFQRAPAIERWRQWLVESRNRPATDY